ncbi:hypothetical protein FB451DRAFT_441840 [Mycena latifolia]|nr:hypothetical protein FB451DRAFT_441840 [Mycena latifolia]
MSRPVRVPKAPESAKPQTLGDFLDTTLKTYISSSDYNPPRFLPTLGVSLWGTFAAAPPAGDSVLPPEQAVLRKDYTLMGRQVLQETVFRIAVVNRANKPAGFARAVQDAVRRPTTLLAMVKKLHPRYQLDVTKVDPGLFAFIGAAWADEDFNTDKMVEWFQPFFEPLLDAAGRGQAEYETMYGGPKEATAGAQISRRIPAGVSTIFHFDLRYGLHPCAQICSSS